MCRWGHNRLPRPAPGGAGYNQGEPTAPSMGYGALSCGRRAWDCSLALGPLSFGSRPNLIKGLYVPACTTGPGSETKGTARS